MDVRDQAARDGGPSQVRGTYTFEPDGDATTRKVEVDIKVKVPLVGGRVESEIKKGLVETMDAEASLLTQYLQR